VLPSVAGGAGLDGPTSSHDQSKALSQQAHYATAAGDRVRMREVEAKIDRLAATLWGLMEGELEEIRESLEELG
jgi:hypothetical protein